MRVCNPHSTRTCDMGLTGLPAFAGQCDRVTHGHAIPLAWFSPTTTSPISLATAANHPHMPLPSPEGCGLACSYSIRGYGRKNTTSVFKHFSFHGFLHLRNPQKPAETHKNQETRKFGNLCPNSRKPVLMTNDGNLRNLPKTTVSSQVILLYIVPRKEAKTI
jgi:hypothetical protein